MAPISVKDINGHVYVKTLSQFLKKSEKVKQPEWIDVVKLNASNELGPYDNDWFFVRCAAILRHIYVRPTGMKGLSKAFSRRKQNGTKPCHRSLAHTTVLRKALQQLEKVGYVEKAKDGGRVLSTAGRTELDHLAATIMKTEREAR